ncbi:unnamed protein product [Orchesella dallaii]|uniref:Thioredoxin domain-containing protein n=1 Tax=Orchesella dallaii TaxID=48710 RepID=A0ABP1QL62_9HEXA
MAESQIAGTTTGTSRVHSPWWKGIHGEEHVVKLNSSNYDKFISERNAFIMFYAQWCGHSQSSRVPFAAAAAKFAREGNSILVGALDCEESKGICARYRDRITGFPTFLYVYAEGTKQHSYRNARTMDEFHSWIIDLQNHQHEHRHHEHDQDPEQPSCKTLT